MHVNVEPFGHFILFFVFFPQCLAAVLLEGGQQVAPVHQRADSYVFVIRYTLTVLQT